MIALQAAAEAGPGFFYALVMGAVEGLTEFLPVSSTGHLIVTGALFGRSDPDFEIAIQAGAITAILVLYWRDLLRSVLALRDVAAGARSLRRNLLLLIVVAAVPAAVVGLALEDVINAYLFDPRVVGFTLVIGGGLLLALERWLDWRAANGLGAGTDLTAMRPLQAFWIGVWQTLALIPGVSRSGATIAGGLVCGFSRQAAAEFSFLVGLPILYGACLLKIAKDLDRFTGPMLPQLLVASAAAFVTALAIVVPFVRFLQRHTFRPFAYYRIVAGAVILALCSSGVIANS